MLLSAVAQHLGFALLLALLSAAAVRAMIVWPILDHPNGRSAHATPTPRGGGVGPLLAFLAGMLVLYGTAQFARIADRSFLGVIFAAVAIGAVGLLDDLRDLSARLRLLAQLGAALIAAASGLLFVRFSLPWIGPVELGAWALPITLFWIVGCTNAVNFMDGLDGLVGGTLLIAAIALAAIAADQGAWFVYAASLFLAAGFAGFLPFNIPRAKIFLGDVGSQFAGFVIAVLAVAAARFDGSGVSALIVPLLLFGLLYDAALTLLRRALSGDRVGEGHRTHLYQMAARAGVPVPAIAAAHWGFALFHAALAVVFLRLDPGAKPLVVLPALAVQLAWTAFVMARMRAAGLGFRNA